jgi:hypothetical protein
VRDVTFCTDLFTSERTRPWSERTLGCLLWGLVFANESYLWNHQDAPPLYRTKVRWQREYPTGKSPCKGGTGQEQFLGIRQIIEQGHADCEDLVCWIVSMRRTGLDRTRRGPPPRPGHPPVTAVPCPWPMRARGPKVVPGFFWRPVGPGGKTLLYHIVVCWPDGYVEDPSRAMGMGGRG